METQVCTQKEKSSDGKLQELLEDLSLGFRGKKTCGHGELTAKKSGSRGLERVLRTQPAGWMRQPRGRGAGRALAPSEGCLVDHPVAVRTKMGGAGDNAATAWLSNYGGGVP